MNGGHKTLNNAKLVIDNLQQIKKSFLIIGSKCHCCAAGIMTKKNTLARGARQLVVQLALDTMLMSDLYSFSLTPTTNMGASLLGAEMTTFLAPPCKMQAYKI
jgi:hypothetical protein